MDEQSWTIVVIPNGTQLLVKYVGIPIDGAIDMLADVLATFLGVAGRTMPLLIEAREPVAVPVEAVEPHGHSAELDAEVQAAYLEAGGILPGDR